MAKKAKKAARARTAAPANRAAATALATAAPAAVTMTLVFGANPPADVMSIRRIDGQALATGRANVSAGDHTTSWDVISPTIRPLAFGVTIVEDATGRVLLSRSQERTGDDGRGAGADRFTV
jgi:hypothetical protein